MSDVFAARQQIQPFIKSTLHNVPCYMVRIHMNGRIYDPNLGRFLSVDPVFEFPTNTQSLNPYSYVLNNPLSMTDPTGYVAACNIDAKSGSTCSMSSMEASAIQSVQERSNGQLVVNTKSGESFAVNSISGQTAGGNTFTTSFTGSGYRTLLSNGAQMTQGAADAQNKLTGHAEIGNPAAISRGNKQILTNKKIGNIVFNETESEHGGLIGLAREIAIDIVMNGDEELGPARSNIASTAKDVVKKGLSIYEKNLLVKMRRQVSVVSVQRAHGIDLASGALHFNFRDPAYLAKYHKTLNSPFLGMLPVIKLGPFNKSDPTEVLGPTNNWFMVYENPSDIRWEPS